MKKSNETKNIIFLYPEITSYFLGCINHFSENFPKINIHIVYDTIFKKVLLNNNIDYEEGKHSLNKILIADEVIKSPGIPDNIELIP